MHDADPHIVRQTDTRTDAGSAYTGPVMYMFGHFVLDLQLFQLRRAEQIVPLEPKVFDVLRYLIEHRDRVATKQELLAALWPNEIVTEAVLPTNINALRRALGQQRGEKAPIETVHGRGYRFAMHVERVSEPPPFVRAGEEAHQPAPASGAARGSQRNELAGRVSTEPMLGHRPLFDKLRRVLGQALEGCGQICVLSGEAGIGKTRAARRIVQAARVAGADVWQASCEDVRDGAPLWIFRQLLRSALQAEGAGLAEAGLGAFANELALLMPGGGETADAAAPLGMGEEQAALRMYDALLRLLALSTRERPRVLWLEDMHHADELSWQLLRMLAPHLETAAVLVLITVRSRDDLTAVLPVQRNLDLLQRAPQCHRFLVRALEPAQVHALSCQLLGGEVDPELARVLHQKSGGNPLFVRELVDWLEVRGVRDASALRAEANLTPPELVRQLLGRRVLRLGADAKRLLEAASVVGTVWDAGLVERVTLLPHEACVDALDAALAHGVVTAVEGRIDGYRFAHDLLRDTLYSDLPQRERRRLHGSIASVLEQRVAWLGIEAVRGVAQHLYLALPDADVQRAIAWLERAASLSEQQASYREAAQFYRQALDAARLLPVADPALAQQLEDRQARLAGKLRSQRAQS
jgi:predicted ATPase/DNA-binding winged helix-turn-helix (wHTH) protein